MSYLTTPLESATRKEIDLILKNLNWNVSEFKKDCNVFTERVRTKEDEKKIKINSPNGRFPDYVLYSSNGFKPIAIIEAKRIGANLEEALEQARDYASCLDIKIIFSVDSSIVEARWIKENKPLKIDGQLITELLSEKSILKFLPTGNEIFSPKIVTQTKEDLIRIFKRTNDLLRQEGMREGIERFTEFSNILFLKLIDEIEEDRELKGQNRRIETLYCWRAFNTKEPREMLDYINDTILPKLVGKYNHSGDVFNNKLGIKNPNILKQIVDKLSELTLLDVDSDIKGDAFEYFLKNSVTVGNDLGEYYTPRHIVKLIVDFVNPKFGDTVYDPCCGTGGFLIEAFRHIKRKCSLTESNINILEHKTIYGGELTGTARIAKMNMILAGDGHTHIKQHDSLENPKIEKFDVVLTNFPFSQKTEFSHLYGLSSKTANAIFLKHVINSLKPGGTAGVIMPDSVLFSKDSDPVKVRRQLVEECDVKAVIQLDVETFLPYTKQPTTIIIFKKGGNTKNPWFFELLKDGFSGITKRKPSEENDIPLLRNIWNEKSDSPNSFTLPYKKIEKNSYKLFLNYYKKRANVKDAIELGDLCEEIILGATPSKKNISFYGTEYLWATIADMTGKVLLDTKAQLSKLGMENMGKRRLLEKETLLMSFKLTLGKTSFVGKELFTNEAICALILKKEYDNQEVKEYLYHMLPHVNYIPFAQRAAKGYTLNKDLIPTVEIPFPIKEERIRLVKKKEALISKRGKLEKQLKENKNTYAEFINDEIMGYHELVS